MPLPIRLFRLQSNRRGLMRKPFKRTPAYLLTLDLHEDHRKQPDRKRLQQHQPENQLPSDSARPPPHQFDLKLMGNLASLSLPEMRSRRVSPDISTINW